MPDKMFDWLMMRMGLPSELPPGKTLIEMVGDCRILVENHFGVISYDDENVRVKTSYGELSVHGINLKLACMSKVRLVITGQFFQISFFRGD